MLKSGTYTVGLLLVTFLLLVGCGEYEQILKSRDYPVKFEKAIDYYNAEEFVKSATLLDQVVNIYRGTTKADTVKYYQAMSYYGQRDYILAGHYFNELATTYSSSDFVEEAEFMTAYCYYKMSPRPSLDQEATFKAISALRMYIAKYPASERVNEARELIAELSDKLVEKSYNSAKLYYDLGYYKSAIIALRNSLEQYPDTQYREELLYLILRSSFLLADNSIESKKKERLQSTVDEYLSFKSEFPDSKYDKEAERMFRSTQESLEMYSTNN
ncbi:MAG: outer membrane protein assembly factor BamD [Bacteroidales bacterium]|nr:outer membrane protein assembly factor BamD [Bacteroidales bacterium]MDT8432808.1 outer membrane protein assembly factor BamD [Bacteroidales bacterium]